MANFSSEFQRPQDSWRFAFGGVNTRDVPDAIPQGKFAAAVNIRSTGSNSIRTRPGYVALYQGGGNAVTDIRGYATLQTDALPRLLSRDANGGIWLDTGGNIGNLNGNAGYGASLVTFRPSESPQSWMYVGAEGDYQKFSAPDSNNNVTQYKVGIAEPQNQVEAAPITFGFDTFAFNGWTGGGTASNTSFATRTSDTGQVVIPDPVISTRFYVQVGANNNSQYAPGELVAFNNNSQVIVQDVFPAIGSLVVQSIRYDSGSTGACTIVPTQTAAGSLSTIAQLRRGSLVRLAGAEIDLVLDVIKGPNGLIAFRTSTTGTVSANAAISGVPAIVVDYFGLSANMNITANYVSSNIATGIGTLTQSIPAGTFSNPYQLGNPVGMQPDDYIHFSLGFTDPTQLVELLVMFNLNGNANNYAGDLLYYAVRPGDLVQVPNGNQDTLGAILQSAEDQVIGSLPTPGNITPPAQSGSGNNQFSEITFPVSALTRIGNDLTRTLLDCTSMRLQVNVANNTQIQFSSSFQRFGGGQPDNGNNGSPYQYQVVPLSSRTGVRGNPTPVMRYGITARRQSVLVKTSSLNSSYDPQIDTWEIYRYGGSVDSYRFIGTTPTGSDFIDNYFDAAAEAGDLLPIDNTEPWPSIDVPYRASNSTAYGPFLIIPGNNNTFPSTITRWLPGTLFQIGGQEAFTLRSRPTSLGGNNGYLFEFEECIGSGNQSPVFVLEPNVARQTLPYLWGPNEQGYVFGCGDVLRPGVVQWCKAFTPDSSPTAYDLELCPPSEPLLGGEVLSGISLVASSLRWWALYFQSGGNPLYSQVEVPVGRRLASPFGKCTDGKLLYFWATDCIAATAGTGSAVSLTDGDLYNLFPHGGLSGKNVVRGPVTFYAPDYSRAATFRIAVREGIIYALYQDSTGTPRMLIGEMRESGVAWETDTYADTMTAVYAIEQPKGTLELAPSLYPAVVMGSNNGAVFKVQDLTGDNNNGIPGFVYTPEWNGGDFRSDELWGDQYVDVVAPAGMTVTPVTQGVPSANGTSVSASSNRQFLPISMDGGKLLNFVGMQFAWTDFANNNQNLHTTLHAWQPSFSPQIETTTDRAADWTDCGIPDNKFFQGILLDADTFGEAKELVIVDADTGDSHALQPGSVTHDGRQTIPYSFATPFLAHSVKDAPQDQIPWRKFNIKYIFEPTPESVRTWIGQWTALGGKGYKHIPRVEASYSSISDVKLIISSFDGVSPQALILPSTGGVTKKLLLTLTLNKGQLYRPSATSDQPFQIFLEDFIFWVFDWGRPADARPYYLVGGTFGDKARI